MYFDSDLYLIEENDGIQIVSTLPLNSYSVNLTLLLNEIIIDEGGKSNAISISIDDNSVVLISADQGNKGFSNAEVYIQTKEQLF